MEFSDNIKLLKFKKSKTELNIISEKFHSTETHTRSFDNLQLLLPISDQKNPTEINKDHNDVLISTKATNMVVHESIESQGNQDVVLLEEHYFGDKMAGRKEDYQPPDLEIQENSSYKQETNNKENRSFDKDVWYVAPDKQHSKVKEIHNNLLNITKGSDMFKKPVCETILNKFTTDTTIFEDDKNRDVKKDAANISEAQLKKSQAENKGEDELKNTTYPKTMDELNIYTEYHSNENMTTSLIHIVENTGRNASEREEIEIHGDTSLDLMIPSSYDEETALALETLNNLNNDQKQDSKLSQGNLNGNDYHLKEDLFNTHNELIILDDPITIKTDESRAHNLETIVYEMEQTCSEKQRLESIIQMQINDYDILQESKNDLHSASRLNTEELPESSLLDEQTFDATVNDDTTYEAIANNDTTYDTTINNDTTYDLTIHSDAAHNISIENTRKNDSNINIQTKQTSTNPNNISRNKLSSSPSISSENLVNSSSYTPKVLNISNTKSVSINQALYNPTSEKEDIIEQNKQDTIPSARFKNEKNNPMLSISINKASSKFNINKLNISNKTSSSKRLNKKISLADLCAKSSPRHVKYRVGLSKKQSVDHLHSYLPK